MKIIKFLILLVVSLAGYMAQAEDIKKFDVQIEIQDDGTLLVNESIFYDFGRESRRGIFRNIPLVAAAQDSEGNDIGIKIDIELIQVLRGGQPEQYTLEGDSDEFFVRIGDPGVYLKGENRYEIQYRVRGALRPFEEYDELYWNATGDEWSVHIQNSSVQVSFASGHEFSQYACYRGRFGSTQSCDSSHMYEGTVWFKEGNLPPGAGLTVAVGFEKNIVPINMNIVKSPKILERLRIGFMLLCGALGITFISYHLIKERRYRNAHHIKRSIVTQYKPIEGINPMFSGFIIDERISAPEITAGIIYVSQQGYFTIQYVPKKHIFDSDDYLFERTNKEIDKSSISEEILFILDLLFRRRPKPPTFEDLANGTFPSDEEEYLQKHTLSEIKKNTKDLYRARKELGKYMQRKLEWWKIMESTKMRGMNVFRFTPAGWDVSYHLKGFKRFLKATELDRYEFFNNIKNPGDTFMEYLPYAIAFGVEKKWAEQFKDIAIAQPDWYRDDRMNAGAFVGSISQLSSSLNTTISSTGSSGSGSSGGGSGGGGGGSW